MGGPRFGTCPSSGVSPLLLPEIGARQRVAWLDPAGAEDELEHSVIQGLAGTEGPIRWAALEALLATRREVRAAVVAPGRLIVAHHAGLDLAEAHRAQS